jgi:hypothetical protein
VAQLAGVVMLIDTRDLPPEPDDDPGRSWTAREVLWGLRWFGVIMVLLVVSYVTSGWFSVVVIYAALYVTVWRGLKLMPTVGGMRDYSQ